MRLFGVMLIMVLLTNLFAADADLRKIREQAAAWFSGSGTASEARRALETQQPDGSWRDVNYDDRNRGHWAPRRHLSRAVVLAAEYRRGREKGAADAKLRDAAVKALGFWAARDCTSPELVASEHRNSDGALFLDSAAGGRASFGGACGAETDSRPFRTRHDGAEPGLAGRHPASERGDF